MPPTVRAPPKLLFMVGVAATTERTAVVVLPVSGPAAVTAPDVLV